MKKILILDIETTGFLNQGGSIVEIGIVELNLDNGEIKEVFNSLIREDILTAKHREEPFGWIFKNSDLTPEAVREAPRAADVFPLVQEVLDKYPLGVTAFNKRFDFDFLRDRGITISNELPCPMLLATDICKLPNLNGYSSYKWPKVEEAWEYFFGKDTSYVEAHRGADDAVHEAKIVHELYKIGVFKLPVKYYMLSQGHSFKGRSISEVILSGELKEISEKAAKNPPWGNGSYRLDADGKITTVADNYDTSG